MLIVTLNTYRSFGWTKSIKLLPFLIVKGKKKKKKKKKEKLVKVSTSHCMCFIKQ